MDKRYFSLLYIFATLVSVLIMVLLTSVSYANKLRSVKNVIIVDSNDKRIGKAIDVSSGLIGFEVGDGSIAVLGVGVDQFSGNAGVAFSDLFCSDPPGGLGMAIEPPSGVIPPSGIFGNSLFRKVAILGNVAFVGDTNAEPQIVSVSSIAVGDSGACFSFSPQDLAVLPLVQMLDLSNFTPPFRAKARKQTLTVEDD